MTDLQTEMQAEKASLEAMRRNSYELNRSGNALFLHDYAAYVYDVETAEIVTRYMPQTRYALDGCSTIDELPGIIGEIEKHIRLLRANGKPWVADSREKRLALYRLNPSIGALRAIWIRKKPS